LFVRIAAQARNRPAVAATEFARAWAVFAVVEWCFSVIVPWLTRPSYDYLRPHIGFSVLLLVLYPAVALAIGAAVDRVAFRATADDGRQSARRHQGPALGTATIALIFAINLAVQNGFELPLAPIFLTCALVILACVASLFATRGNPVLGAVVSPWTASVLLLGLTWLTRDFLFAGSRVVKLAAAGVYAGALVALAWLLATVVQPRVRAALPRRVLPLLSFPGFIPLALVLAVLAGSAFHQTAKTNHVAGAAAGAAGEAKPDVLLIVLDTVRADHLSVFGYPRDTTPNLRAFAEHATVYPHAIAASNMTLPSHASLFTGLYPGTHGAHFAPGLPLGSGLALERETIAELLAHAGYRTIAVAANYAFLGPAFQLDQGFQEYDQRAPIRFVINARRHFPLYPMKGVADLLVWAMPALDQEAPFLTADQVNAAVFGHLRDKRAGGPPQFLFINYMDAHWPYLPAAPFDVKYPGKDPTFTVAQQQRVIDQVIASSHEVTPRERDHWVSQYDGGIAYLDAQLGELFARLKALNRWDDSLIIVTSDHGEAFGERNVLGHAIFAYQNQVHVPLLVKYPGQTDKHEVRDPVSGVDIFPTILDVARQPVPRIAQGQSLLSVGKETRQHIFTETFPSDRLPDPVSRFHQAERAIFEWPMKFIASTGGKRELYDLAADPDERHNLDRVETGVAQSLGDELKAWVRTDSPVAAPGIVDKATRDRLKSLGYTR
jgi:arylsulfatase A-like enzyme